MNPLGDRVACLGEARPVAIGGRGGGRGGPRLPAILDVVLDLLALPSGLLIAAYRAYAKAREQQNNLRLLHEITSLLYNSDDAPTALTDFLTAVRGAFRRGSAELVLFGEDDALPTLSRSRDGEKPVALRSLEHARGRRRAGRLGHRAPERSPPAPAPCATPSSTATPPATRSRTP